MNATLDRRGRPACQKRSRLQVIAVAVMAAMLGLALSGSTWADGEEDPPTPYIGDGIVQGPVPPLSVTDQALLDAKDDLSNKYALVFEGQYDRATWEGEWSNLLTQQGEDVSQHIPATGVVTCPSNNPSCIDSNEFDDGGIGMTVGERRILYQVPQYGISQPNYYYCGAATAYAILAGLGKYTSYYGEQLSQYNIARTCSLYEDGCSTTRGKYTQTNYWVSTPWTSVAGEYPMRNALNKWRIGSNGGYYAARSGQDVGGGFTEAQYKTNFTMDIDTNYPVAGNVGELANNVHLDQHPTGITIWHWVAIRGYSTHGDTTHYVDSVYQSSGIWWSNQVAVPNHRVSTHNMWQMLQHRGYVW